jgi:hypothetical protein
MPVVSQDSIAPEALRRTLKRRGRSKEALL